MAQRGSAARRYAEAAFQVAERDGTVDTWRRELADAAVIVGQPAIGHTLANPSIALETRAASPSRTHLSGRSPADPCSTFPPADAPSWTDRGPCRTSRPSFAGWTTPASGITIATATAAASLSTDARSHGPHQADSKYSPVVASSLTSGWIRALLGGLVRPGSAIRLIDGSVRGRLRATAKSASFSGALLGDLRPMAIRSDEITSIIKSAIDSFDAVAETRSVGTVVEVGDGIARVSRPGRACMARELVEFPERRAWASR